MGLSLYVQSVYETTAECLVYKSDQSCMLHTHTHTCIYKYIYIYISIYIYIYLYIFIYIFGTRVFLGYVWVQGCVAGRQMKQELSVQSLHGTTAVQEVQSIFGSDQMYMSSLCLDQNCICSPHMRLELYVQSTQRGYYSLRHCTAQGSAIGIRVTQIR